MMVRIVKVLVLAVLVTPAFGCPLAALFFGLESSSPTQRAVGLRVLQPAYEVESSEIDVLPFAGYQRQWWDNGHDNVFTVGAQGRKLLNPESGLWGGGELTYNYWVGKGEGHSAASNVIGVGGVLGKPVSGDNIHLWGSLSLLHFGDFKEDGEYVWEGGNGWQINVGLEVRDVQALIGGDGGG